MKYICIERKKDKSGKITDYVLQDEDKRTKIYKTQTVKDRLLRGTIEISNIKLDTKGRLRLNSNMRHKLNRSVYELMHAERKVAAIDSQGKCNIYYPRFMPYNLYLEETQDDIDILVSNLGNFYYWCATRVLTLDRQYAKEILNCIGATQSPTDRDRAEIALTYHCLSLTDVFWVRKKGEKLKFANINLYENHLDNAFIDVALRGRQMTIQNSYLIADDVSTNGCFPKAWLRRGDEFLLLKDGGISFVRNEVLASKISQCFVCNQVIYEEDEFEGDKVSVSSIITSLQYSIVSEEAFEIYATNKDLDPLKYILKLDAYSYYMMNIIDYLVGNTDRHWGNWGLLVDNKNNRPVRLHDLMDFNQCFQAYDSIEGAACQTLLARGEKMTQQEAALIAVGKVGLNKCNEVKKEWFRGNSSYYNMFIRRLQVLQDALK